MFDVPGNTELLAILLPLLLSKFSDVYDAFRGYMMKKQAFSTVKGEDQQVIMPWSLDMY